MKKSYQALAIMPGYESHLIAAEASAYEEQSSGKPEPDSYLLQMADDVAIITIKGTLTNNDSPYNKWYGLVSYNEIRNASMEAVDLGAGAILYDIDSPGGKVSGMKDISNFTSTLDLPTIAHTSSTMASAAYFFGISTDHVFSDDMAEVGSVGVVMTAMEYTEAMKKQGVSAEVFRSGRHKQAGNPYEKLSAENRKYLQDQVDLYAGKFFNYVSEKRGMPLPAMEEIKSGKTFIGEQALAEGLVDKIMSFDQALAYAYELAEKTLDKSNDHSDYTTNRTFNLNSSQEPTGETMKKTLSKEALAALVVAGKVEPAPAAADSTEETLTQEQTAALAAEGSEEHEAGAEGDETTSVEFTELQEKFDASQVELAESAEKLVKAEDLLREESDKVAVAEANLAKANESTDSFKAIVVGQINSMRVALSLSSVDMEKWTAESVLSEYESTSHTFEKSLPIGGVVPDKKETKTASVESRDEANKFKNLGF